MNDNQREETLSDNSEKEKDGNGNVKDKVGPDESNNTARTSLDSQNNGNFNQETSDKCLDRINELKNIIENLTKKIRKMEQESFQTKNTLENTKNTLENKIKRITEESLQTKNTLENTIKQLESEINTMEDENNNLANEIINLKEKMFDREVIIKKNNFNIDLLANRDSLKSILLLLSFNLKIMKKKDIQKISSSLIYKTKFTSVVVSVLKELDKLLNPITISRQGFENNANLSPEKKKLLLNTIKFVECIQFIVCTIDNIVHPEKEVKKDSYSKIMGNRGEDALKQSLFYFFEDPKTVKELKQLVKKEEEVKNQENKETNENKNAEINLKDMGENIQNIKQTKTDDKNIETELEKINKEKIAKNIDGIKEGDKNSNTQREEKKKEETKVLENVFDKVHDDQNNDLEEQTEIKNEIKKQEKQNDEIISKNIKGKKKNELQENEFNNELIDFENYYFAKNKAYIQNKKYYLKLENKNTYIDSFFIQYLFKPDEDSFSDVTLSMNYTDFISILNQTKDEFQSRISDVSASDLINKLKWLS